LPEKALVRCFYPDRKEKYVKGRLDALLSESRMKVWNEAAKEEAGSDCKKW